MEKIEEFVMILLMQILNKLVLFANLCMEQGKSFQWEVVKNVIIKLFG